ncbi:MULTISPECIES: hypothetical protein [unclassified Pseudomonas]|uniref:hypothetical protein n=1 Tax=unclassified Pseudomonas TaxID=196821 RepID=UPI00200BB314|nr:MULTISPECIES: hypothetical protein [unclassified Pseudomonas]
MVVKVRNLKVTDLQNTTQINLSPFLFFQLLFFPYRRLMLIAIISATSCIFFAALTWFINQTKSLSTLLDKQDSVNLTEDFLSEYKFRLKIHTYFKKNWPKIKRLESHTVKKTVSFWTSIIFFLLLITLNIIPESFNFLIPPLLFASFLVALIGNTFEHDETIKQKLNPYIMPGVSILTILVTYTLDTSINSAHFKSELSTYGVSYNAAILLFIIVASFISYIGLEGFNKLQSALGDLIIKETLLLAKNLVRLGVIPEQPEEIALRAIAKDSVTATASTLNLILQICGAVFALSCVMYAKLTT